MRYAAISLVTLTLTLAGAGFCRGEIAWEGKLRDAHAKAKRESKLMLLHFYSDNCVWCDRLEEGAFRSQSVIQTINDNFVPVKIHGTENKKLAEMFKVSAFPTDVVVTTDGKALAHSVSPQQPDRYIAMLATARKAFVQGKTMLAGGKQPRRTTEASQPEEPAGPNARDVAAAPKQPTQQTAPSAAKIAAGQKTQLPGNAAAQIPPTSTLGGTPDRSSATVNQFAMPSDPELGVQASLAGVRTEGMSLSEPKPSADNSADNSADKNDTKSASGNHGNRPELAIDGYCPVSVVRDEKWIEGKPEFGVIHLGKLYVFASEEAMNTFLNDPLPYTPMLNGIDVVHFFEEHKIVPGRREWGVIDPIHNRMFFFADEEAMVHFENEFQRYLDAAIEVMDQAIEESNPGA